MSFMDDVLSDASGKWPEIFGALGIELTQGTNIPCPACGGTDRFTFDDRQGKGDYFCRQCGNGNGIALIAKCKNTDFKTALHMVAGKTGTKPTKQGQSKPPDTDKRKKWLNEVWTSSTPLTGSDPVSRYLHGRGIVLRPNEIRYCPKCYDGETKQNYPAMIAMIRHQGKPVGLHRTFLEYPDSSKRKKMMPKVEPLRGGVVQLFQPGEQMTELDILGVAEGIETACAATQLFHVATWAALGTSLLEAWEPPEKYIKISIFGDRDKTFAGQKSAYVLANRIYKERVVDVQFPDDGDFNDVLREGKK